MSRGYAVFHEMHYDYRDLERGEYVELEFGLQKNDKSLLNIGYIKEHDGDNLEPCLRCGKKFVDSFFLRHHEETCPMVEVEIEIPQEESNELEQEPVTVTAGGLSIAERAMAARSSESEIR